MKKSIIIKIIISLLMFILSIYFVSKIYALDMIPNKYMYILDGLILLFNIIGCVCLLVKKKWTKVVSGVFYIFIVVISVIGMKYVRDTDEFLEHSFENLGKELTTYNVLVLNDSKYKEVQELKGKTMGYLSTDEFSREAIIIVCNIAVPKYNEHSYEDLFELYGDLINKKLDSIVIDANYMDTLEEEYKTIYEDTRVLYSFDIDKENEANFSDSNEEETNNNGASVVNRVPRKQTNERSFSIYISGSDSRSSTIANKSRSDVNMVMTINRNTKKILLTSIPRDYYVQVHNQVGLKDKLTHAGVYGLDRSRQTVEDLFNINIDYAIKVNMNSVVEVVNLVGGIEVYSDTAFRSSHMKNWNVEKGINYMDGAKALAYSRERYAYAGGDRHRILNQQQVLEAVIKKITSNASILLKYDELLNSLSNLYRTTLPRNLITSIVKEQLDIMSGWTIDAQAVDGSNASRHTYIGPKYWRYVMIPYENDIVKATNKINEILG